MIMDLLVAVLYIALGFFFLMKGADFFVDSASGIAAKLGVSSLIIGLTIVAFGTSLPELAVSVTAALDGSNEIAVGNVVGSNIFNLLVVAGMSACIYPLVVNKTIMKRDWPLSAAAALLLAIFLIDAHISRMEALILLACFAVMLFVQIKHSKKEKEEVKEEPRSYGKLMVYLIVGVAGIIIGGQLAVDGATNLARILGLSETLIGLTVVAIGTSLPELVTSIVAAKKNENEIAMGNVIGSNLFNIFFILGISPFLNPISVAQTALIDTTILIVISVVFWLICRVYPLNKKTGLAMVLTYVAYTIYIILR